MPDMKSAMDKIEEGLAELRAIAGRGPKEAGPADRGAAARKAWETRRAKAKAKKKKKKKKGGPKAGG